MSQILDLFDFYKEEHDSVTKIDETKSNESRKT